jgi:hypothetical protein
MLAGRVAAAASCLRARVPRAAVVGPTAAATRIWATGAPSGSSSPTASGGSTRPAQACPYATSTAHGRVKNAAHAAPCCRPTRCAHGKNARTPAHALAALAPPRTGGARPRPRSRLSCSRANSSVSIFHGGGGGCCSAREMRREGRTSVLPCLVICCLVHVLCNRRELTRC